MNDFYKNFAKKVKKINVIYLYASYIAFENKHLSVRINFSSQGNIINKEKKRFDALMGNYFVI